MIRRLLTLLASSRVAHHGRAIERLNRYPVGGARYGIRAQDVHAFSDHYGAKCTWEERGRRWATC